MRRLYLMLQIMVFVGVISGTGSHLNATESAHFRDKFRPSQESRLIRHLAKRYKRATRTSRPVTNSSLPIIIEFSLALIQILDFDETNQVLMTNVWKRYRWYDEILIWDPTQFGGIKDIRLPADMLWTPDIMMYNHAADQEKLHHEMTAVYSDGRVRWIPPAIYKSSCQLDMRNFPFDEQTCQFKFGSWMYDGKKLDLTFYDEKKDLDLREYLNSSEWLVLNTRAEYNRRFYPCCGDEAYPDITFYLTVKRRTAFYIYVLILPSVLLSFLTLLLFWIPPQRPDRTNLGMSLFSSFFVLLLILVQSSPPTSASISLLGLYYCMNMVMIAFSTMLSVVVINLTHYLQMRHIPIWVKTICIDVLGRILCANRELVFREECLHEGTLMEIASERQAKSRQQRDCVDSYYQRNLQWRVVAQVIDRVFFLLYIIAIILSLIFIFPK